MTSTDEWFDWGRDECSLQEIIDHFDFPLIVKVKGGHCGDTALESVSKDEVSH